MSASPQSGTRGAALLARMRRVPPALWVLGALLVLGLALRIALSVVLSPLALNQADATWYVFQADGDLFGSPIQAPGYSLFLRLTHLVSDQVAFTISVQHLLILAEALALWWVLKRLTGSAWLGLIPAAFALFDADALLVEHALMSEALFGLLVVAMVATATCALNSDRAWRWLAAAGLFLGAAIWVRYAALALIPVLVGWALVAAWPGRRAMLAAAAAAAATVSALIGVHVVLQGRDTGYYGLSETGGWALYSRVAGFADCERFDPPPGTEALCEDPAADHPRNPDWYGYNEASPAKLLFGGQPAGDAQLRTWARRALVAQPLDYAQAVWDDLMLFFFPQDWTNGNEALIGPRSVAFALRTPDEHCDPGECQKPPEGVEGNTVWHLTGPEWGAYYAPFTHTIRGGIAFFQDYQSVFRTHGWLLLAMVLLSLAGLLAVRGRLARAQWLLTLVPVALLLFPVMSTTYNIRYAIPVIPLFAAAAALAPLSLREGAGWIGALKRRAAARVRSRRAATLDAPPGSPDDDGQR